MTKKLLIGLAGFLILFLLFNYTAFKEIGGKIMGAMSPVFFGLILALILNAPVKLFEKYVFKGKKIAKARRFLSLASTLIIIVGVLALLIVLIVPEVSRSIEAIGNTVTSFDARSLIELFKDSEFLYNIFAKIEKPLDMAINFLMEVLPGVISKTVSAFISFFIGIMFGLLMILNKDSLYKQIFDLIKYFTSEIKAAKFMASLRAAADKFSKFMSGQLLEALIFGVACYIMFIIFRLPYAALIALIMGIANLIPILGAYMGGIGSFLIVLTVSPEKAIIFAIIIITMQQVEQFTTYPLIVGRYVGISAFWVMFAVTVGGSLFGFAGLILGVPTLAFIDNLFNVISNKDKTLSQKVI